MNGYVDRLMDGQMNVRIIYFYSSKQKTKSNTRLYDIREDGIGKNFKIVSYSQVHITNVFSSTQTSELRI